MYNICRCDTRPSVRYLMREKKRMICKVFSKPLTEFKARPLPPKQSVKFKCKISSEITSKFANKSLDASSL